MDEKHNFCGGFINKKELILNSGKEELFILIRLKGGDRISVSTERDIKTD